MELCHTEAQFHAQKLHFFFYPMGAKIELPFYIMYSGRRKMLMLRTEEQIAVEIGVDVQVIKEFLTAHKIRAAREDGQKKYYDEATQAYLRTLRKGHGQ